MGWGRWRISSAVLLGAVSMSCSNGGAGIAARPVSASDEAVRIQAWRSHWTSAAEPFWDLIPPLQRDLAAGDDAADASTMSAAAPRVLEAAQAWEASLVGGDVPGDLAVRADRLREAVASHRRTWAEILACGPVVQCHAPLADRVDGELARIASAQFALRPRF